MVITKRRAVAAVAGAVLLAGVTTGLGARAIPKPPKATYTEWEDGSARYILRGDMTPGKRQIVSVEGDLRAKPNGTYVIVITMCYRNGECDQRPIDNP